MNKESWQRLAIAGIVLIGTASVADNAQAGDVKDVITDLYGGDGILLGETEPFPHEAHFTASSLGGLSDLGSAVTANAGQFAFNSTVTGFVFDIERGVPVRTTESLGPLLAERANTLGAGRVSLAASYTRIDFKRFEGTGLDDLSLTFVHDDVNEDGILAPFQVPSGAILDFELDQIRVDIDLDLSQEVLALFATYGVTEAWDVGVVVPLVRSQARAVANATIIENAVLTPGLHEFDPARGGDSAQSIVDREASGIGDVIARTKYNFLRDEEQWPDLAVVGRLKLPTGDEDDLLGTGETDFLVLLVASKPFDKFTPHLNLGYEVSTDSELSNLKYIVGFDHALHPQLTAAVEILGRWEPEGDGIGDHVVDAAVGAKWNPVGDALVLANIQVPLNRNEGLRPDFIWTVGVEIPF